MSTSGGSIDGSKVAIYIRWSTDDQGEGTTLEVQSDGCRHYLLSQGWTVNEKLIFVDDGYSGGNLDRPALAHLRERVSQGEVSCVVVFKVDRLSRSVIDTVNLVLQEWDGRTYLKSAREPIDTTTAMGKQFFYMLVSYAEWERSVIRERTVAGRRRRATQGYKPSAVAPYGYCHAPGRRGALAVVESEAEILREIFRLSNSGLGSKAIASQLQQRGTPYRENRPWKDGTILYMLKNPIYVGDMVYGRKARNPHHGKRPGENRWLPAEPLIVPESPFIPPIIARAEFERTQALLAQRSRTPGRPSGRANASPYLLTGLARCRCGHGLYAKRQNRPAGAFTYCCIGKRRKGGTQCDAGPIPMAALDREIGRRVKERFGGLLVREGFSRQLTAGRERSARLRAAERSEAHRLERELADQLKRISREYRQARISADEYHGLKAEIEAEVRTIGEKQAAPAFHPTAENPAESAATDPWESLTAPEQKLVLRHLIDRLVVYRSPGAPAAELDLKWKASTAAPAGGVRGSQPTVPIPAQYFPRLSPPTPERETESH